MLSNHVDLNPHQPIISQVLESKPTATKPAHFTTSPFIRKTEKPNAPFRLFCRRNTLHVNKVDAICEIMFTNGQRFRRESDFFPHFLNLISLHSQRRVKSVVPL